MVLIQSSGKVNKGTEWKRGRSGGVGGGLFKQYFATMDTIRRNMLSSQNAGQRQQQRNMKMNILHSNSPGSCQRSTSQVPVYEGDTMGERLN